MLTGSDLLAKVKELGDASKSDLLRGCGYVSAKKDGTERLNFTRFYEALLEAKGMNLRAGGAGETFPHDPAITEAEAQVAWVEQSQAAMVAVDATDALVGTSYLRPNSLALGAHVANAGWVVADHCRLQGVGSRLCQHSLQAARRLGFRLMQFNLVVSTNTAGIRCWQRNGFQVIGTLPGACRHKRLGDVDALVMVEGPTP